MGLPDDIEFVFVDDGSNPPLQGEMKNLRWHYTNDKRPWTQGLARNAGAKLAQGDYFFFTDIDHIITKEALMEALAFDRDLLRFWRDFGILDENGILINDADSMIAFGLNPIRLRGRRGLCAGMHGNTYSVKRDIFERIGGYDPRFCQSMFHVGGSYMSEERRFNYKFKTLADAGVAVEGAGKARIYMFPIGRFRTDGSINPHGLFHQLSLDQGTPLPMLP